MTARWRAVFTAPEAASGRLGPAACGRRPRCVERSNAARRRAPFRPTPRSRTVAWSNVPHTDPHGAKAGGLRRAGRGGSEAPLPHGGDRLAEAAAPFDPAGPGASRMTTADPSVMRRFANRSPRPIRRSSSARGASSPSAGAADLFRRPPRAPRSPAPAAAAGDDEMLPARRAPRRPPPSRGSGSCRVRPWRDLPPGRPRTGALRAIAGEGVVPMRRRATPR